MEWTEERIRLLRLAKIALDDALHYANHEPSYTLPERDNALALNCAERARTRLGEAIAGKEE